MANELYDPETDTMVSQDDVPSYIWEELIAVADFISERY